VDPSVSLREKLEIPEQKEQVMTLDFFLIKVMRPMKIFIFML
jgi:hypothetical protein